MTLQLDSLIQQWLSDLAIDRAPTTVMRYTSVLRRFSAWMHDQHPEEILMIDGVTPIALAGYVQMLKQHEQRSTVNIHIAALRTWGTWLANNQLTEINPSQRLKFMPEQRASAPRDLSATEVNALLREVAKTGRYPLRNTAIMMLLIQTGIRIGECVALRWGDIAFGEKKGWLHVRAGKGNISRSVPLNHSARTALADYVAPQLAVEPTLRAVSDAWQTMPADQSLWQSERGVMTLSAMERAMKNSIDACIHRGVVPSDTTPHALRHTFAHRYLAQHPNDLVGLSQLLGHSSLDTTAIYVKPTAHQLEQRLESLDLNVY